MQWGGYFGLGASVEWLCGRKGGEEKTTSGHGRALISPLNSKVTLAPALVGGQAFTARGATAGKSSARALGFLNAR